MNTIQNLNKKDSQVVNCQSHLIFFGKVILTINGVLDITAKVASFLSDFTQLYVIKSDFFYHELSTFHLRVSFGSHPNSWRKIKCRISNDHLQKIHNYCLLPNGVGNSWKVGKKSDNSPLSEKEMKCSSYIKAVSIQNSIGKLQHFILEMDERNELKLQPTNKATCNGKKKIKMNCGNRIEYFSNDCVVKRKLSSQKLQQPQERKRDINTFSSNNEKESPKPLSNNSPKVHYNNVHQTQPEERTLINKTQVAPERKVAKDSREQIFSPRKNPEKAENINSNKKSEKTETKVGKSDIFGFRSTIQKIKTKQKEWRQSRSVRPTLSLENKCDTLSKVDTRIDASKQEKDRKTDDALAIIKEMLVKENIERKETCEEMLGRLREGIKKGEATRKNKIKKLYQKKNQLAKELEAKQAKPIGLNNTIEEQESSKKSAEDDDWANLPNKEEILTNDTDVTSKSSDVDRLSGNIAVKIKRLNEVFEREFEEFVKKERGEINQRIWMETGSGF